MENGYIKLWRKSLDSEVFMDSDLLQLWLYCLVRASYKGGWVPVVTGKGQTRVFLKPGQLIFGSKQAGRDLGKNWNTTYRRLKTLEKMGNVQTQNCHQFTIVTICKWSIYQNAEREETAKPSNSSQTQCKDNANSNQRQGKPNSNANQTYKKDKNEKKDKNKDIYTPHSDEWRLASLLLNRISERKKDFRQPDLQNWSHSINLLINRDKRKPQVIEQVIEWCQQDHFWQNNVLSAHKLYKHFDRLELEMNKPPGTGTFTGSRKYIDEESSDRYANIGTTLEELMEKLETKSAEPEKHSDVNT